jgi:hypothetical protein
MKYLLAICSLIVIAVMGWMSISTPALANEYASKASDGADVYFIDPQDGDTVPGTFTAKFGLSGMEIAPAGVDKEGTGHHHLLVDLDGLPNLKEALPATEHIKHFGGGQTEVTLTLPPGEHSLQLLLANYAHIPHEPPVLSKPLSITVK